MPKTVEWKVVCPNCGLEQSYHSYKKKVKGKRRKKCNKCGRSFIAKDHVVDRLSEYKKKKQKEMDEKGTGFHKYSRSD